MAGIKGKVSAKDLKKFAENLQKLSAEQTQQFNEEALRELAKRLLAKAIKRTPVGIKPKRPDKEKRYVKATVSVGGKKKNVSFMNAEEARYQQYWSGYTGGNLRRGWTVGEVVKNGNEYQIDVINSVEYAPYVEFGHRQTVGRYVPALGKKLKQGWVEGHFMLTVSEQELQADAPRVLKNKLEKFVKDMLE